jgi:hypothetical protein
MPNVRLKAKRLGHPRSARIFLSTTPEIRAIVEQFAALDGVTVNEWAEQAIIRCLPLSVKRNLLEPV